MHYKCRYFSETRSYHVSEITKLQNFYSCFRELYLTLEYLCIQATISCSFQTILFAYTLNLIAIHQRYQLCKRASGVTEIKTRKIASLTEVNFRQTPMSRWKCYFAGSFARSLAEWFPFRFIRAFLQRIIDFIREVDENLEQRNFLERGGKLEHLRAHD